MNDLFGVPWWFPLAATAYLALNWLAIAKLTSWGIERRWRNGFFAPYVAVAIQEQLPVVEDALAARLKEELPALVDATVERVEAKLPGVAQASAQAIVDVMPQLVDGLAEKLRDSVRGTLAGVASGESRRDAAVQRAEAEALLAQANPLVVEALKASGLYNKATRNPAIAEALLARFGPQVESALVKLIPPGKGGATGGGVAGWK